MFLCGYFTTFTFFNANCVYLLLLKLKEAHICLWFILEFCELLFRIFVLTAFSQFYVLLGYIRHGQIVDRNCSLESYIDRHLGPCGFDLSSFPFTRHTPHSPLYSTKQVYHCISLSFSSSLFVNRVPMRRFSCISLRRIRKPSLPTCNSLVAVSLVFLSGLEA